MKVPKEKYEGNWQFTGYFPRKCKQKPPCRMDTMKFSLNKGQSNDEWISLETTGNKVGETCSISETK